MTKSAIVRADVRPLEAAPSAVQELLDLWVAGRKPDTVRSYLKSLVAWCDWLGVAARDLHDHVRKLDAPTANLQYLRYARSLVDQKYASNTVNTRLTAVRSFLSLCRTAGWIDWTLEVKSGVQPVAYRDTRGPGHDGFTKILESVKGNERADKRDRAVLWLMYSPALRRDEICKLDVGDLELAEARVKVWQKKKRDQVYVTLPKPVVAAIEQWLVVRRQCGPCAPSDPLFVSLDPRYFGRNVRLDGAGLWKIVAKRAKVVGIRTSPHRIRHAAITHALDLTNGNIREVAKFSRHANYQTVAHYDDNRTNLQGKMAQTVARAICRKRKPA